MPKLFYFALAREEPPAGDTKVYLKFLKNDSLEFVQGTYYNNFIKRQHVYPKHYSTMEFVINLALSQIDKLCQEETCTIINIFNLLNYLF